MISIIIKNLTTTLKRYSTSVSLNIVGLSIAFATSLIIMMQVTYEYGYDSDLPAKNTTYRVAHMGFTANQKTAIWAEPMADVIRNCSPHVKYGSLHKRNDAECRIRRANGAVEVFTFPMQRVNSDMKDILGLEIVEGNVNVLSTPRLLLIPQSIATTLFGNESAVGKQITAEINQQSRDYFIGAVYKDRPSNSVFPNGMMYTHPDTEKDHPGNWNYNFYVTLDSEESIDEFEQLARKALVDYYGSDVSDHIELCKVGSDLYFHKGVEHDVSRGDKPSTDMMIVIALLIMTIAIINYVNFASALSPVRMKNINMQKILGGRRFSLRCSLIFESVAITVISYLLSLVIIMCLSSTPLLGSLSNDLMLGDNMGLLLAAFGVAVGVGVLAGLYPAYYMTSFPPIMSLKGSFGMSPVGRHYRSILVSFQYVVSTVLIIMTLFIALQSRFMSRHSVGYDREQVLVTDISSGTYFGYHYAIEEQLRALPEVESVAFANGHLGDGAGYWGRGRGFRNYTMQLNFNILPVSYNFLDVLGIAVTEGRNFTESDLTRDYKTAIFNQAVKSVVDSIRLGECWGDINSRNDDSGEIVGFMPEGFRSMPLNVEERPFAFLVLDRMEASEVPLNTVYIRMSKGADVERASNAVMKVLKKIDPITPIQVDFLDTVVANQYSHARTQSRMILLFSFVAIMISLMGVFGLVLFETQYRRKEIGVRRVFGATVGEILAMFNRKFMIIVSICFVIAVPIAWYLMTEWLANFTSHIPIFWWVFFIALLVVALITSATVSVRTIKAANANPAESVKTE